jgi:SAM-dependent methyltransferase
MPPLASLGSTSRGYVELEGGEDELLSFRYVRPSLQGRVLDIGCGKGVYLAQLPAGSVGVDLSRPNLERCRARGLTVEPGDLNGPLPFPDGSFSAVLCSHVLEHVDSPIALLRECHRVMSPGGTLVLGLPVEPSLPNLLLGDGYYSAHPGHLYAFSLPNARWLLAKTGFAAGEVFFEPRGGHALGALGGAALAALQRAPAPLAYVLAQAYWVVAARRDEGR